MYPEMNNFNYKNDVTNLDYVVSFSKHLFQRREGDSRPRGYMFETIGQIKRFLTFCFNDHDLGDYLNKGKIAVKFTYKNDIYAALIVLERNLNIMDDVTRVTFITIDKLDTRHYNLFAMYHSALNTIDMSGYILRSSNYARHISYSKIGLVNIKSVKYTVINYPSIEYKINKLLDVITDCTPLFNSVLTKTISLDKDEHIHNNGAFWISVYLITGVKLYIKMTVIEYTEHTHFIIVMNVVTEKSYYSLIDNGRGDDPYYDLNINKVFGVTKIENNINKRNIRIKKKSKENNVIN